MKLTRSNANVGRWAALWRLALCVVPLLMLVGCGESPEEAYERGYEDGWAETCDEIRHFSYRMEQVLKEQRIC